MTYRHPERVVEKLTDEEWVEMIAIKQAIAENPSSVHPRKMEYFTELLVRSDSIYSRKMS
jgi:hypothetical protein|tara:strand:+ start:21255 stop:21434 length:180 start_codon:yes stop_codon:yes gene_type:complete